MDSQELPNAGLLERGSEVTSVRSVLRVDRPSADKSYVIIEVVPEGFRVSGMNLDRKNSDHLPAATWRNFIDALDSAKVWAVARGIKQVFVVGDRGDRPA